jgi:hypothetical protein
MNIFETIRNNPNYSPQKSVQWFQTNVTQFARGLTGFKLIQDTPTQLTNKVLPGQMYFFYYDAKYRDTLPYWDKFPLVLPFNIQGNHMTGLNLHYLPPKYRLSLLSKLMNHVNNKNLDDKSKFLVSWKLLQNAAKFPEVRPCIKQYILGRVKTRFLWVKPEDWFQAIFLPVQGWMNNNEQTVFKDSRRMIR